jgi:cyanophycinase
MTISRSIKLNLAFLAALLAGGALAQGPEYGPAKGTLVIQGGGSDAGTGIFETFINKAGGLGANIVVVPTAGGNRTPDGKIRVYQEEQVVATWKRRGVMNVHMLHTADPKVADTEEFAKILRDANGVWFDGGRQWNIVDSYANTLTLKEFHNVLERGGVIGGSSAGATIQGDYLVRGAIAGSDIVMTPEPEHEHGFKFLRKVAIDQHINTRNRWDDIIPVIKKYPEMLGIGLSEGTAIVVTGDRFQVIGKWKVAIHDNTRFYQPWEKPYYVLSIGDVYNMKTRTVEKYGTGVLNPPTAIPAK